VDLPEPDGPQITITSPLLPCRAVRQHLKLAIPLADIFDFDHRKRPAAVDAALQALDSARAHKDTAELANSFSSRTIKYQLQPAPEPAAATRPLRRHRETLPQGTHNMQKQSRLTTYILIGLALGIFTGYFANVNLAKPVALPTHGADHHPVPAPD
jgi:hypothetical protein